MKNYNATVRFLSRCVERNYVVKAYGAIKGGNQTLDRLSAHMASL
ncbi:hypothetical protein [Paenibacillus terrigena]|nr:hypothetical protein [Paenibacillus terrigena]